MTVRGLLLARGGTVWDLVPMSDTYDDIDVEDNTYSVRVIFRLDGTVDVLLGVLADLLDEVDPYVSPASQTDATWVRCTFVSGDNMTAGDAVDVFHQIDSQRSFTLEHAAVGSADTRSGTFNFELSSDSSGTPIEASKNSVVITVGTD